MDFKIDTQDYQQRISHYKAGELIVSQIVYTKPIILTPQTVEHTVLPATSSALERIHIDYLCQNNPEVILIGAGPLCSQIDFELQRYALLKGFALEVMRTDAACRTFSLLASEYRQVIAALFV